MRPTLYVLGAKADLEKGLNEDSRSAPPLQGRWRLGGLRPGLPLLALEEGLRAKKRRKDEP